MLLQLIGEPTASDGSSDSACMHIKELIKILVIQKKHINPIAKVCYKLKKASANSILVPEGELIYFFMTNLTLINTMAYGTGTY